MRAQLLAIDLDGTLLTSERQIHPENKRAIADAIAAGMIVVLASGRIQPSMAPFAQELALREMPLICCNGAHVIGIEGQDLRVYGLDNDARDQIAEFARARGLHLNAYTPYQLYFTTDDAWGTYYVNRVRTLEPTYLTWSQLSETPVFKLMFVGEPETLREANQEIRQLLDPTQVRITESEPEYLEFLSPHAHKGAALSFLSDSLGINASEVAAVGDYLNDLEMLQFAGQSAAMGNATSELKEVARYILPTNDEGGVAWLIRNVLLQ